MIHVIAAIEISPGKRDQFLDIFRQLVPKVQAEDGCMGYGPAVDCPTDIELQQPVRENVVTVIEKWESVEALKKHLTASHMEEYRQAVQDLVTGVQLYILEPA